MCGKLCRVVEFGKKAKDMDKNEFINTITCSKKYLVGSIHGFCARAATYKDGSRFYIGDSG